MVDNRNDLRLELEQMTTDELAAMLQAETGKEVPDDDLVLLILDVLEGRVAEKPVELNPREKAIWKRYLARAKKRARPVISLGRAAVAVAATLAVVFGMLFVALPKEAKAGSIYDVIAYCTDSLLEFFGSRSDESMQLNYEFKTDHPGLQKLHDTVVEYGYDGPAVPMWIPEEYNKITAFEIDEITRQTSITMALSNGDKEIIIFIVIYNSVAPRGYYKDNPDAKPLEMFGTVHYIVQNFDNISTAWEKDNIEGFITLDCQEDNLQKIIKSIYVMEDI